MSGVISVRGLAKRYGSKTVVDRLDLEVPQGAVYAFLGDNGAGKTSTIKVLVGMHPPDRGSARVLGQDCGLGRRPPAPGRVRRSGPGSTVDDGHRDRLVHRGLSRNGFVDRYHE